MAWLKVIWSVIKAFFSVGSSVSGNNRADFDMLTDKYRELYNDMYEKQELRMSQMESESKELKEELNLLRKEVQTLRSKLEEGENERDEIRMRENECAEANRRLEIDLAELTEKYEALKIQINEE